MLSGIKRGNFVKNMPKISLKSRDWSSLVERQKKRGEHPVTPSTSSGILALYKKYFEKAVASKKRAKVIVLGATPELRDIALQNKCELVTVDLSLEQVLGMEEVMKHRNSPEEIIVRANWLKMVDILKNQTFDLITGDSCFCNLSAKDQEKLAEGCRNLLKKNGYLLIRDPVPDLKKPKHPSYFYIKKYRQAKMKFADLFFNLTVYASDIKAWNLRTKEFSYFNFNKKLKELYQRKILNKEEFKRLEKFASPHFSRIVLAKQEFESLLKKYFKLVKVEQCKDLELCQSIRFYLGRPKK